jgi:hypothetical protein
MHSAAPDERNEMNLGGTKDFLKTQLEFIALKIDNKTYLSSQGC